MCYCHVCFPSLQRIVLFELYTQTRLYYIPWNLFQNPRIGTKHDDDNNVFPICYPPPSPQYWELIHWDDKDDVINSLIRNPFTGWNCSTPRYVMSSKCRQAQWKLHRIDQSMEFEVSIVLENNLPRHHDWWVPHNSTDSYESRLT